MAFIDIHKAFDTSWVEGALVRLFDAGVSGQMWKLMSHFLRGTESQVRVGSFLSEPWFDSCIAQRRVLSSFLFNLLGNGLAAAVRRSAPGAQFSPSGVRFPFQLDADDVVLPADSVLDLQTALDAVSEWKRKWRFTFGIALVVPSCAVTLAGSFLPVVNEFTYLGVVLTPSLTWLSHVRHLISRGNRLFPSVSLGVARSSLSAFRCLRLSVLCASQHFMGIGVLPFFQSRCSVDRRRSAQVGSSSSRLAFRLPQRCGFP